MMFRADRGLDPQVLMSLGFGFLFLCFAVSLLTMRSDVEESPN
jgi:hypothetical protein